MVWYYNGNCISDVQRIALDQSRMGCVVAKILPIELLSMDNGDSLNQGHGDDDGGDDDGGGDDGNDLLGTSCKDQQISNLNEANDDMSVIMTSPSR